MRRFEKKEFCLLLGVFIALAGCGSLDGSAGGGGGGSGSGSAAKVQLAVRLPDTGDGNASKAAKAVAVPFTEGAPVEVFSEQEVSVSKATVTKANISQCRLNVSGSDFGSKAYTFTVPSGATSVTGTVAIPEGKERYICVECRDTANETKNIPIGFHRCTTTDIGSGTSSLSLDAKHSNLITDDASDGLEFARINMEDLKQIKIQIGFGKVLSATEKSALQCLIEFNREGYEFLEVRSSVSEGLGSLDPSAADGLKSTTKTNPYWKITGVTDAPRAYFVGTNDTRKMRAKGAWTTTDAGNTLIEVTYSFAQGMDIIDEDLFGGWAVLCSLTGQSPWDRAPNTGFALYNIVPSGMVSEDIDNLQGIGETCATTRNGETCRTGYCASNGVCAVLADEPPVREVVNAAGPAAGTVQQATTDGTGIAARFNNPYGLCFSPNGQTLYVTEDKTVRQLVLSTGAVTTLAGDSSADYASTDGTGSAARFYYPQSCVVDPAGTNMYIPDSGNNKIRKMVIATTVVSTYAGTGAMGSQNGALGSATFASPAGITMDSSGANLYIADLSNGLIRKIVLSTEQVSTVATVPNNDSQPTGLVLNPAQTHLYVANQGSGGCHIVKIELSSGTVTTIAGLAGSCSSVDAVTGAAARFSSPTGIAVDWSETLLYIAESYKIRLYNIETGKVTTIAGAGTLGDANAFMNLTSVTFGFPYHIALSYDNQSLYVADQLNHKIRVLR